MNALIVVTVVVVLVVAVIGIYNGLIKCRVATQDAASNIIVILKQRADLLPNLVETVKGYAKHEQTTLSDVTTARAQINAMASQGSSVDSSELAKNANFFSNSLARLLAVSESYPDLKANQNFLKLQETTEHTENSLVQARRFFNGTVREYETKRQVFPSNIIADIANFKPIEFYDDENAKESAKGLDSSDVKVSF
ncbi:MAG: LemA family protein [Candidatus Ancillula trichonymphae]|jgi:LemA protein|nr:LemA family protein [Candidatus Ancillula trichonymphae]